MKSLIIGSLAIVVLSPLTFAYATSTDNAYDGETTSLVANILNILDNDVPPADDTGNSTFSSHEIIAINVLTPFIQKDGAFTLTPKSINERRNGGVLLKNIQSAVEYLSSEKLTKYTTAESFQPDASLRRDEAAKFFSVFAKEVMHKTPDTAKKCEFNDLASGHTDLQTNMVDACKLGIFNGNNGSFNPTKSLTNGEALAVLMRITSGKMDESNTGHRAMAYRKKAQSYGLTQGTFMDSSSYLDEPITRGNVARLIEAASYIPALKLQLGGDVSYSFTKQGYVTNK